MVATGLNREIESKEISGSLACDGYASSLSSLVGCPSCDILFPERRAAGNDEGSQ